MATSATPSATALAVEHEDAVPGTWTRTDGTGAAARWVTVTNGSTIQPMTSPRIVPRDRLTNTTLPFSSHSEPESWRPDSPSARRSANSVRRWRAETPALRQADEREQAGRHEAERQGADDPERHRVRARRLRAIRGRGPRRSSKAWPEGPR